MSSRRRGVLCHLTSLPGFYGVGDFGRVAYEFVDLLAEAGMTDWQILPLNPTAEQTGNSPYTSISAFALNPLFLSTDSFNAPDFDFSILDKQRPLTQTDRVDYSESIQTKHKILQLWGKNCDVLDEEFSVFLEENRYWIEDYALYCVIKREHNDLPWFEWPEKYKNRDKRTMQDFLQTHHSDICAIQYEQFILNRQWQKLKTYANSQGVSIIGDLPIYIDLDSCDVWAHRKYFKLNEQGARLVVGGVPPDYFSETGQLWGNPIYDWDVLTSDQFEWWIERIKKSHRLFNSVRIDHFRGLVEYWEIPIDESSAVNGRWVKAPAEMLLYTIKKIIGKVPIIAEDLGVMSDDVARIMDMFNLPGMKVLQFAFDSGDDNPYLPHNYSENCVVYTGTHDNNTTRGWFVQNATDHERSHLSAYVNQTITEENVADIMINLAFESRAGLAIIPVQDILNFGSEARLNIPGQELRNWEWKMVDFSGLRQQLRRYKI